MLEVFKAAGCDAATNRLAGPVRAGVKLAPGGAVALLLSSFARHLEFFWDASPSPCLAERKTADKSCRRAFLIEKPKNPFLLSTCPSKM